MAGVSAFENYFSRYLARSLNSILTSTHVKINHPFKNQQSDKTPRFQIRIAKTEHSIQNYTFRIDFNNKRIRSFAISGDGKHSAQSHTLVSDVAVLLQEIYSLDQDNPVHENLEAFAKWVNGATPRIIGIAHHSRSEISKINSRARILKRKDSRWLTLKPDQIIRLQ